MILHPNMSAKTVVSPVDEDMIQMHALDIRIGKVYRIAGGFFVPEKGKTSQSKKEEMFPLVEPTVPPREIFNLMPGVYAFDAVQSVEMAEGEAGWLVPRSSLTRNGVDVRSALYDAGYKGGVNGIIVVHNPHGCSIERNARVAQFVIVKAETAKLYDGQYQGGKK